MSVAALLKDLRRVGAFLAPLPDGHLWVATPRGRFSVALREQVLAAKPVLRAVAAWDTGDAERLVARLRALVEQARPADYPAQPSPAWEASEFRVEAAYVTRDTLGLVYAVQAHLHFAYAAFSDWERLRRMRAKGGEIR